MQCPSCGGDTTEEEVEDEFEYGVEDKTTLMAVVPVITCNDCGESFTDYRGEEARDAAVQEFLASARRHS